ncbi:S-layer homology domain-containing protein [Paenibacillus cymbidii]|uniref:S-layer homology domain-containing protein n=1 Tax=Paenibacillus cymbidii TaxID=1639034 RepID=UPI0010819987|nr:S-layer homology domain-containing protein [Paenibacillus cymbidii]
MKTYLQRLVAKMAAIGTIAAMFAASFPAAVAWADSSLPAPTVSLSSVESAAAYFVRSADGTGSRVAASDGLAYTTDGTTWTAIGDSTTVDSTGAKTIRVRQQQPLSAATDNLDSTVTAADSTALRTYLDDANVSVISLKAAAVYNLDYAEITRQVAIHGNGATIVAGEGKYYPVIEGSSVYHGHGFLMVMQDGDLRIDNMTLSGGGYKILTVINAAYNAQVNVNGVKFRNFFGEHDAVTDNNNADHPEKDTPLSFAVHTERKLGYAPVITVENSSVDDSNAFRNAIAVREGTTAVIRNNTFVGASDIMAQKLRDSDGYEYALFLYGGTATVTGNTVSGYDNSFLADYTSSGIAITPFLTASLTVTLENNYVHHNYIGIEMDGVWAEVVAFTINGIAITNYDQAYAAAMDVAGKNVSKQNTARDYLAARDSSVEFYTDELLQFQGRSVDGTEATLAFKPKDTMSDMSIEQSADGGSSWSLSQIRPVSATVNSVVYDVYGLNAGTAYKFRMTMVHADVVFHTTTLQHSNVVPNADGKLHALESVSFGISPAFSRDTTEYSVTMPEYINAVTLKAESWSHGSIRINGVAAETGLSQQTISVGYGWSRIPIVVTSQDGTSATTYYVNVYRSEPEATPSPTPTPTPAATAKPNAATRQVDVVVGELGGSAAKVDITRKQEADGTKLDEVVFEEKKALEAVDKAKQNGQSSVRIVIDDLPQDPADAVAVTLAKQAIGATAGQNVDLSIQTNDVKITLPQATLGELQADDRDLYFRIVPIVKPDERQQVETRVTKAEEIRQETKAATIVVLGKPMTIETNYADRRTLVEFPLPAGSIPADPQQREAFLAQLAVYIEHSDGTKELQKGTIKYDAAGNPAGIEIAIDKFSTFTIVRADNTRVREPYWFGYEDGTFRPDQPVTRAEIAALIDRSLGDGAATEADGYADVPDAFWASAAVARLQAAGIMAGDGDGLFRPQSPITRAEMAAVLARWKQAGEAAAHDYADTSGHWAADAIDAATAAGWLDGYPDGSFRPEQSLTRAEAAKLMNRALGRPALEGAPQPTWPDVPEKHWAYAEIEAASTGYRAIPLANGNEKWVGRP